MSTTIEALPEAPQTAESIFKSVPKKVRNDQIAKPAEMENVRRERNNNWEMPKVYESMTVKYKADPRDDKWITGYVVRVTDRMISVNLIQEYGATMQTETSARHINDPDVFIGNHHAVWDYSDYDKDVRAFMAAVMKKLDL